MRSVNKLTRIPFILANFIESDYIDFIALLCINMRAHQDDDIYVLIKCPVQINRGGGGGGGTHHLVAMVCAYILGAC